MKKIRDRVDVFVSRAYARLSTAFLFELAVALAVVLILAILYALFY